MKKGKKGWLLLMAFTTWAVLIAGCGKWTGNKQDKVPEVTMAGSDTENMENPENSQSTPLPDIQELTYYVHGTMMELIRSVSLIRQGEKALVRIEPWDGEEEELFDYPVDAETLDANSHFPRPAGPHFPASQGHIKRSALEIGRARGAPPC